MSDLPPARIGAFAGGTIASSKPERKMLHRPQAKPKPAAVAQRPPAKTPVVKPSEARMIPVAAHTRAPNVPRIVVSAHTRAVKVADAKGKAAKGESRKVAKAVAGMTAAKLGLINASKG